MHKRFLFVLAATSLTATLAWGAAMLAPEEAAAATTWKVDQVHSTVLFKVRHLGVSNFYGRFNEISGSYEFDAKDPASSRIEISVPIASLDSNSANRDGHLRGPEFFSAEEFPEMTFRSLDVKQASDGRFKLKGEFTLRGVTHPVQAEMHWLGEREVGGRFGTRSGFEAKFTIKRSKFGMTTYVKEGMLGDDVQIIVAVEGMKQETPE